MATPDRKVIYEQPVRNWVDWRPELLRSALLMADGGALRLAADLCESINGDSRIGGIYSQRVDGLLGLPFELQPNGDARRKQSVAEACAEDFPKAFPANELSQLVTWGLNLGVGLGELVWIVDEETGRFLPKLKVWHPRWLRYDWQQRGWFLTVAEGTEIPIAPGDGKWILYTPYGDNRPWANGLWIKLRYPWLAKRYAQEDWSHYGEVHGNPTRVNYVPDGTSRQIREEITADTAAMGGRGTMTLPAGYDQKMVEATARTWETFEKLIGFANVEFAITIAAQNLTTEVKGGSRAAATVHQNIGQDKIEFDELTLSGAILVQALVWWALYNFGSKTLAPRPHWKTEPPQDAKTRGEGRQADAQALLFLAQAAKALRAEGVKLELAEILEEWGTQATVVDEEPPPPQGELAALAALLRLGVSPSKVRTPDQLEALGLNAGRKLLAGDVDRITAEIERCTSFEQLRAHLPAVFSAMDPEELSKLLTDMIVLADLMGRASMKAEQGS